MTLASCEVLEHHHPYMVSRLASIFLTFVATYLHISCFTHKLENGTLKSGRPLIAKQIDSSNNLANP
jgi:predicted transcriptional regulator